MDAATLARALLDAAWITARLAAVLAALGAMAALWAVHARSRAGGRGAITHRRAGAGPRIAAMLGAAFIGAAVTVFTRGQAGAWLPPPGQAVVAVLAMLSSLTGGMIAAWAAAALGVNLAVDPVVHEGGGLVTNGPYALVRHPFYAALALLGSGAALAWGSPLGAAAYLLAYAPAARWRAVLEEELLAEAWPAAWPAYAARTPRFVPKI